MGHSCDAYELFEVSGDELRAVIRDDSRSCIGVLFSASLDNRFDIDLLHFLADFPMDNRAGTAVQDAAHEVKSTAYIQIADIDVPMLVGSIMNVRRRYPSRGCLAWNSNIAFRSDSSSQ
jgi:hypothetical protein